MSAHEGEVVNSLKDDSKRSKSLEDLPSNEARYVDEVRIGFDAYKFVLVFQQSEEITKEGSCQTRIIFGPETAKIFLENFQNAIKDYENFFKIKLGMEN